MTPEQAIAELTGHSRPQKSEEMAIYHKVSRPYLGVATTDIDRCQKAWRTKLNVPERVDLARGLWASNIFEARVAAAKLLTQARLRPDDGAWDLIQSWVPEFDSWALADHVATAGQKRLIADPAVAT